MKSEHELELQRARGKRWRQKHPGYSTQYYAAHKEHLRQIYRDGKRAKRAASDDLLKKESEYRYKLKREVLSHYGTELKCVRCGIEDIRIIGLDHINGDGAKERREGARMGIVLYRRLRDSGYPPGFQILCLNCNVIKRIENKEYYHGPNPRLYGRTNQNV